MVVDTTIDTLRVNKSRINMIFARKLNHLSKVYQFYCLGVIWAVLPCGTCINPPSVAYTSVSSDTEASRGLNAALWRIHFLSPP